MKTKHTTIATLLVLIALCFSGLTAGAADKATVIATLNKIANSSKPEAKEIYERVIKTVENGTEATAKDKAVLKMDRALFQKRGKADAVEAIDHVLKSARGGNARPTVNKVSATSAEALAAAAIAFRQIDGDLENGEVSGDREAKLKSAVEAGVNLTQGEPVAQAQDNAERLSLAADKAERDAKSGQMSADDTEDALEIAGAYRVLASALLNSSSAPSAVTTPAIPPAPALPAPVVIPSGATSVPPPATSTAPQTAGLPGGDPRPANPGPAISPGATDVPPRALPMTETPKVEVKGSVALRRRSK